MTDNSFNNHHKNKETIVPEHESAVQTSEREELIYRIEKIKSPQTRQSKQDAFLQTEEFCKAQDARIADAENSYVDLRLRPEHLLEPQLGWDDISHKEQVRQLKRDYAKTPAAKDLAGKVDADKDRSWQALRVSVSAELRRQEHSHER